MKKLNLILIVSSIFFCILSPAHAERTSKLHDWLKYYYLHQDISQVVPAMDYFFHQDQKLSETRKNALIASFSILFRKHPDQAKDWIEDSDLKDEQRKPLIHSLWYAGLNQEARDLAKEADWSTQEMAMFKRSSPALTDIQIENAPQVALLWGAYRISGDPAYITRVIQLMLSTATASPSPAAEEIAVFAAQSLNIYMSQHDHVEQIYLKTYPGLSADEKLHLDLLLSEHTVSDDTLDCE